MLHRFLLTIQPSSTLSAEVQRLRALLHPAIGSFSGRTTPPHITLCFLDLPEAHGPAIMETIARGNVGHQPFTLRYYGITHFPDKRTIYIDPVEKDVVANVRKPIISTLKEDPALGEALRETDHPHLTIAAGLKPGQFDKAWEMLVPHEWHSEERVGEVVLFKRPLRSGTQYEPVRQFPFG